MKSKSLQFMREATHFLGKINVAKAKPKQHDTKNHLQIIQKQNSCDRRYKSGAIIKRKDMYIHAKQRSHTIYSQIAII